MIEKHIKHIVIFVIAMVVFLNSVFTVQQSEQAIVLQFGELVKVIKDPGLHFKLPFIQNVTYFDKRLLNVMDEGKELIAKDQKRVIISAYAKYRILDPLKFYQTVRSQSGLQSRLNNILNSSLRQVIGDEPLAALLTDRRSVIMNEIQKRVNLGTKKFGIDVVDVRILRADLPVENSAAIYKRMQSEREKEAKEFRAQGEEEAQIIIATSNKEKTILLAEATKKSSILRGHGDAEATKVYADAFKVDPQFYSFYRSLEAYRKSFQEKDTAIYLSSDDGFLQLFNKRIE
jgi:modulator of FtsH protease HflC